MYCLVVEVKTFLDIVYDRGRGRGDGAGCVGQGVVEVVDLLELPAHEQEADDGEYDERKSANHTGLLRREGEEGFVEGLGLSK